MRSDPLLSCPRQWDAHPGSLNVEQRKLLSPERRREELSRSWALPLHSVEIRAA
jgi:hypothetical protein